MFTISYKKLSAKICFFVFFTKMLISATPIFSCVIDKGTILQVVMQLEIETTSKANSMNEDLHDQNCKFFNNNTSYDYTLSFPDLEDDSLLKHYLKDEKGILGFHPSVPTPPPNC